MGLDVGQSLSDAIIGEREGAVATVVLVGTLDTKGAENGRLREQLDALDATTGVLGFFGASSMERLPTERAIAGQARDFKSLTM